MNPQLLALGVLCWTLSLLFTASLTVLVSRPLRTARPALDLAIGLFVWVFLTTLMTFLIGLLGMLRPIPLGLAAAGGLVLAWAPKGSRMALRREWAELRMRVGELLGRWQQWPGWLRWATAGFLGLHILRFAFLIWALPPFTWDSLTYHLTNVAQWVQDGRIGLFDTSVQRIYLPANYEVLASWFAVFLHHDLAIEAAGLPAFLLAGVSVYTIGRGLGISPGASWIGAMAYLSTPALVLATTGTKNDPLVAATYLLLVALAMDMRRRINGGDEPRWAGHLVVMILAFLYALGTKAYILHLAPGVLVVAAFGDGQPLRLAVRRFLDGARKDWARRFREDGILLSILLVGGLGLGLYWNLRDWVLTGNPFYPYSVTVADQAVLDSGLGGFRLDLSNLVANLALLGAKFGDKAMRIVPDLPGTTGWGWVAYGMGLPSAIWAWIHKPRFRIVAVGFIVSLLLLLLSSPTSPWNMRYAAWFPAVLALGLALLAERALRSGGWARTGFAVLLCVNLAMNTVMTLNYNLIPLEDFQNMLARSVWDRHAGLLHVRAPLEYESVYRYVPADAVLGYNLTANGFVYPLYRADFSQRLVYVPFTPADSCESIAQAMASRGTRYLFVAPEHSEDLNIARLRECAADGSVLRERAIGLYVTR